MRRADAGLLAVVFLVALGLRGYDLGYPPFKWLDETPHVAAALRYWDAGQFLPDYWEHPPLRHLLLRAFLAVFGDGPVGWRLRNVLFGAAAAALTAALARQVSGSRRAGLAAGLLLATDPLHVVLSRSTWEEVYGGAFFLAAVVAWVGRDGRSWRLALSALLMGCALATKWYYVPAWLLLLGLTLAEDGAWRDRRAAAAVACTWLLLPLGVYALAYWPWFARGYGVGELVEQTVNGYHSLQSLTLRSYQPDLWFLAHTSSLEWFTGAVVVGQGTHLGPDRGEFILYMNSWPIWGLTLPALAFLSLLAWRRRAPRLALPALLLGCTWALFLVVRRPAFIYSAAPLLPFAFTAVATAGVALADRAWRWGWAPLLAAALAWNGFLYPLATAKQVPLAPYRELLRAPGVRLH